MFYYNPLESKIKFDYMMDHSQGYSIDNYWFWSTTKYDSTSQFDESLSNSKISYHNFESYNDLKIAARNENPDITKEEMYLKLLEPFKQEKIIEWSQKYGRLFTTYLCKYDGCNKKFTKTWNMLDHVRMHEGIKPFDCKIWGKQFTQKGNLKKHHMLYHSNKSIRDRKKFECIQCNRKYTEKYNLVVNFVLI